MVQTEGFAAAPPTPVIDRDGKGISPTINLQKHAERQTASKGSTAECQGISIDTRTVNCYNSPSGFAGIDTVHIRILNYDIADNNGLTVQAETDSCTGAAIGHPLYETSYGVIEGTKAFFNHPAKLFRFTIRAHGEAYVNAALPRLLYGDNRSELTSIAELHLALDALERLLMEAGIRADLRDDEATVSRLDLCRTVQLESLMPRYSDVVRSLEYPRTEATNYKNGARWSNGSRQLCIYDKGKEQGDSDSNACRLEYRLMKGRTVESTIGTKRVAALLQPATFRQLSTAYIDATGKLLRADAITDTTPSGVGIDAVVEALKDHRGGYTKALLAIAISRISAAEREALCVAVNKHFNRQREYTLRRKMDGLQCYADLLSAATRTRADLYAELKKAFTEQKN